MPERYVDVSHEALIRAWPRLQGWLNKDRAGLFLHRQITKAAEEWQRGDQDEELLYRGTRLVRAQEWREFNDAELNPLEREFLDESRAEELTENRAREQKVAHSRPFEALTPSVGARLAPQVLMMFRALMASPQRNKILLLGLSLVAVIGATAYGQILLNAWNRPFYDALARRDLGEFLVQLMVFGGASRERPQDLA
jgi:hypothetical protein